MLLQTYIEYIASYENFENYKKVNEIQHSKLQMQYFINISEMKFEEGMKNEILAKQLYGTIKSAVEDGIFRPL